MAAFSNDLRVRLVNAVKGGISCRQVASRFDVSPSAVIKLMQRVRATGSVTPARIGGYRQPLLTGYEDVLVELTRTRKGITLAGLRAEIIQQGGPDVSLWTVWSMLRRLGLRHKKRA